MYKYIFIYFHKHIYTIFSYTYIYICRVFLGDECDKGQKTSVKKRDLNPAWHEKLELHVRSEQVCCSILLYLSVCCSLLQSVEVYFSLLQSSAVWQFGKRIRIARAQRADAFQCAMYIYKL